MAEQTRPGGSFLQRCAADICFVEQASKVRRGVWSSEQRGKMLIRGAVSQSSR
jgi:hypothetical protein